MSDPIEIPPNELSDEALQGLLEEYVTRDGTDYGEAEVPLTTRVLQVRRLLARGEASIFYDPETRTCSIVLRQPAPR